MLNVEVNVENRNVDLGICVKYAHCTYDTNIKCGDFASGDA